jgi:hypothetical protein
MDTNAAVAHPTFTSRDHLAHIITDIVKALADREGESPLKQAVRTRAATHTIMAFRPRDAIEAMVAGHCVMFHEMMVASVHFTLHGEEEATRRATRSGIVAMDRAFGDSIARWERFQTRAEGAQPDEAQPQNAQPQNGEARTETGIVLRHQTPSGIAACLANPEAMAAIAAADPLRFAHSQGVKNPSEAYLAAAAAQMADFHPRPKRSGDPVKPIHNAEATKPSAKPAD